LILQPARFAGRVGLFSNPAEGGHGDIECCRFGRRMLGELAERDRKRQLKQFGGRWMRGMPFDVGR
jgi:hypothetical protein